jgi:hypothetical protein
MYTLKVVEYVICILTNSKYNIPYETIKVIDINITIVGILVFTTVLLTKLDKFAHYYTYHIIYIISNKINKQL